MGGKLGGVEGPRRVIVQQLLLLHAPLRLLQDPGVFFHDVADEHCLHGHGPVLGALRGLGGIRRRHGPRLDRKSVV